MNNKGYRCAFVIQLLKFLEVGPKSISVSRDETRQLFDGKFHYYGKPPSEVSDNIEDI